MSAFPDLQQQKSFQYLLEVETVAQEILTAKNDKLELSNARNKFREALRAVEGAEERRVWMQLGSVYVQRPRTECLQILKKELNSADQDILELERKIKENLHKFRDLEHEPRLEGFTLKPISAAEAKAMHKAFGLV